MDKTAVINWHYEKFGQDIGKECKEAMESDHFELWRPFMDAFTEAHKKPKHAHNTRSNKEEYMMMINHAPHGSRYRKLGVVKDRSHPRSRAKRLVFSYIYNNDIYRTSCIYKPVSKRNEKL